MPQQEQFRRIEQVMPKVMNMGPQELQHLQLSLYELSKFHEFGCGGISKLMINPQGGCYLHAFIQQGTNYIHVGVDVIKDFPSNGFNPKGFMGHWLD